MLKKLLLLIVSGALLFAITACTPTEENGEENGEPANGINDETDETDENDEDEIGENDNDTADENDDADENDENDENGEDDAEDENDDELADLSAPDELEYTDEGIIAPEDAREVIEERAYKTMEAFRDQDQDRLAKLAHPEDGVRFTPYTHVNVNEDQVFMPEDMENFFEDSEEYYWGRYDGVGDDIALTPAEYYEEFIYTQDFIDPEEIGYNEIVSDSGTMEENQFEVYQDAIIVEYYFSGFDEEYEGMDWESLRLVFQYHEDTWYLAGVIYNQWTT